MKFFAALFLAPLLASAAPLARDSHDHSSGSSSSTCSHGSSGRNETTNMHSGDFPTLAQMLEGNKAWADETEQRYPGMIGNLSAQAQRPKAYALICSDSRVPIEVVTGQAPGTYFVDRNIANQYSSSFQDIGAESAVAYAVEHLEVKHLIVLGHYGCGGIAAAIASPVIEDMNGLGAQKIADWVRPIRKLYLSSEREEIVAYRELTNGTTVKAPVFGDPVTRPAFRALIEENVKSQARNLARDDVVNHMWEEGEEIYIHSWVYNLDDGRLKDLNYTIGPATSPELYMP